MNTHLAFKGPHELTKTIHRDIHFIHNALYTSGGRVTQPLIAEDKSVYAMVDGSIYNCNDFGSSYESSEQCVLDAYAKHGTEFATHLDGDYSVVIVDFTGDQLLAVTDVFGSKPLFWALDDEEFGFSSHDTPLGRVGLRDRNRVPPNTVLRFKLQERKLSDKIPRVSPMSSLLREWANRAFNCEVLDWAWSVHRCLPSASLEVCHFATTKYKRPRRSPSRNFVSAHCAASRMRA